MKKLFAVSLLALFLCSCGLTSTKVGAIALVSDVKQTDEVVQISNINFSNLFKPSINSSSEQA